MQKKKIAGYIRAKKLMDTGVTQAEACKLSGLSRMTFNKYRELFGDAISDTEIEVLPQVKNKESLIIPSQPAQTVVSSDLERIMAENAALSEQLKLRKELSQLMH